MQRETRKLLFATHQFFGDLSTIILALRHSGHKGRPMDSNKINQDSVRLIQLEAELERLKQSYRFQLGDIIADLADNPASLPKAIKRLVSLYTQRKYTAAMLRLNGALEIGQPNDPRKNNTLQKNIPLRRMKKLSDIACGKKHGELENLSKGATHYELLITERLRELSEIASEGLNFKIFEKDKQTQKTNVDVAMILHKATPLAINGYTLRSEKILNGLRAQRVNTSAFVRTRKLDMPQPYLGIGEINPSNDQLSSYIEAYASAIEKTLERVRPKVVHAASNYVTGLSAGIAAKKLGIPFIYEIRGLWEVTRASVSPGFENSIGYAVQKKLETQCALLADVVLAISTPLADELISRGVSSSSIQVLPNGADIPQTPTEKQRKKARARLQASEDEIVVGFIGSVTQYEGLETLLFAIRAAREKGIKLKLAIVGGGQYKSILEVKTSQLGIRSHCCFLGKVSPTEAEELHFGLDIASYVRDDSAVARIIPPLKPLQSMASGVATIVSDLPALVELVGGHSTNAAKICQANNIPMLVSCLVDLAENHSKRAQLAIEGKKWVTENRSWLQISKQLKMVYEGLPHYLPHQN